MPTIRPSADLRNNYNEVSELLAGKLELYNFIEKGLDQVKNGKVKPMKNTIKSIREEIN